MMNWKTISLFGILVILTSCEDTPCPNLNQVVIGEVNSNNQPTLTYSDLPKLNRALQLAFLPGTRIDTIFLYKDISNDNNEEIILIAIGQENDSVYTSVNFVTRQINGISLVSNPETRPRYCTAAWGCVDCVIVNNRCDCESSPPGRPCALATSAPGGSVRPFDVLDFIIPFLAK